MSTKRLIISQLAPSPGERKPIPAPPPDHLPPLDYGIDSLGFTVDVARLEDQLQVDPITADEQVDVPVTLEEFVPAYERLVK
jgi:acyl carrier protein